MKQSHLLCLLLLAAQMARGGDKPIPVNLPDPIPDVVAMVKAEKPVKIEYTTETTEKSALRKELNLIYLRQDQWDSIEAGRLFLDFAERNRGTTEGAIALLEAVRHLSERGGVQALRLAEEYPASPCAPESLATYVDIALFARTRSDSIYKDGKIIGEVPSKERVEPSLEDWQRILRAVVFLAGRYPGHRKAWGALLDIADVLYYSQRARPRALELYSFIAESNVDGDSRFGAFKALHDDALARGDMATAESLTLNASRVCAGCLEPPNQYSEETEATSTNTPWDKMLANGIPGAGEVLLPTPPWNKDICRQFDVTEANRGPDEARTEKHLTLCLFKAQAAKCLAGVTDEILHVSFANGEFGGPYSELAMLGKQPEQSVSRLSLLFLPKFPVREGVDIIPYNKMLIQQEAHKEADTVLVSINAGKVSWKQTWRAGQPWWDQAELKSTVELYQAYCPSCFRTGYYQPPRPTQLLIKRAIANDDKQTTSDLEVQRHLLSSFWRPKNGEWKKIMLEILPKYFNGEELTQRKTALERREDVNLLVPQDTEAVKLREISALLREAKQAAALEQLDKTPWYSHKDEALVLRAQALLATGALREAAEVLRGVPRRGKLSDPHLLWLQADAWAKCGEKSNAQQTAREFLISHPQATEAAQVRKLIEQLGAMPERDENPFSKIVLRSLWRPPAGEYFSTVAIDRQNGKASILIGGRWSTWQWRISPEGEELQDTLLERLVYKEAQTDRYGTGAYEIGVYQDLHLRREADRIIAADSKGMEKWRYTAPTGSPTGEYKLMGLPFLAHPQLVSCPAGMRIISGVGQRTVIFGMGIGFNEINGGIIALNLQGQVLFQRELGYCEDLCVIPSAAKPLVAGLFVLPGKERFEHRRVVRCCDASTGEELWQKEASSSSPYQLYPPAAIYTCKNGNDSAIVVSAGRTIFFSTEGKILGENPQTTAMIVDINNDGRDEIVTRCDDSSKCFSILDLNGKVLWTSPRGPWTLHACEDLDGDGWKSLLVTSGYSVGVFGRLRNNE